MFDYLSIANFVSLHSSEVVKRGLNFTCVPTHDRVATYIASKIHVSERNWMISLAISGRYPNPITSSHDSFLHVIQSKFIENCSAHDRRIPVHYQLNPDARCTNPVSGCITLIKSLN